MGRREPDRLPLARGAAPRLRTRSQPPPAIAAAARVLARFGHALSDPVRARLLLALRDGPGYPAEFAGGIGDAGAENLKKFVENGGKLVCLDDSCELVIKRFNLPMKNVLQGVRPADFYNPGSIVKIALTPNDPLGRGLPSEVAAYFINSSAFEITDANRVRSVAKYAVKDALMSGWMLGEKMINGKTALAETDFGKGKIVLFAFRPQHRGQTYATFPLLFNSLENH